MVAVISRPVTRNWVTISFASTLYLCPILDLLLAEIPDQWHTELRLGLQEALVNAAKHGNQLDPIKNIVFGFCCDFKAVDNCVVSNLTVFFNLLRHK